jgi:hypothetical protein
MKAHIVSMIIIIIVLLWPTQSAVSLLKSISLNEAMHSNTQALRHMLTGKYHSYTLWHRALRYRDVTLQLCCMHAVVHVTAMLLTQQ